jgi:hypothetical protein
MAADELKLRRPADGAAVAAYRNETMAGPSFEQFRRLVLQDPALQGRLRDTPDRGAFIRLTVQLGNERGYTFTAADVEDALRRSQRAWVERWISR